MFLFMEYIIWSDLQLQNKLFFNFLFLIIEMPVPNHASE